MKIRLAAAVLAPLGFAVAANADVVVDYNGFPNLSHGQVGGMGLAADGGGGFGYFHLDPNVASESIPLYSPGTPGLMPSQSYSVDFFHNSGAAGSDFGFTMDGAGTGVASVTTSGHGGGPHQMVTGFTAGNTTLLLNAHNISYNVGGKMTGSYWVQGYTGAHVTPTSVPLTLRAIPGENSVDHLYTMGAGNEDWSFAVDGTGQTSAGSGASGPGPVGSPHQIPRSEYATFSGSSVELRTTTTNYAWEASDLIYSPVGHAYAQNNAVVTNTGGSVDMDATVGSAGFNLWTMAGYTVLSSNILNPDGTPLAGTTGAGDFIFAPLLRYDGLPGPGDGFYFQAPGGGKEYIAYATIVGLNERTGQTVTVNFTAAIPEPAGLGVLAAAGAFALARRRR